MHWHDREILVLENENDISHWKIMTQDNIITLPLEKYYFMGFSFFYVLHGVVEGSRATFGRLYQDEDKVPHVFMDKVEGLPNALPTLYYTSNEVNQSSIITSSSILKK